MTVVPSETARPRRWPIVLALVAVLPVALVAHGWETVRDWWNAEALFETGVSAGTFTPYGGADWKLAALHRMATRDNGAEIVLAELEATVTDTAAFATTPCELALAAGTIRWLPLFMDAEETQAKRPDLAYLPSCNVARSKAALPGERVRVAESFEVPADQVDRVVLQLAVPGGRPDYLVFQP